MLARSVLLSLAAVNLFCNICVRVCVCARARVWESYFINSYKLYGKRSNYSSLHFTGFRQQLISRGRRSRIQAEETRGRAEQSTATRPVHARGDDQGGYERARAHQTLWSQGAAFQTFYELSLTREKETGTGSKTAWGYRASWKHFSRLTTSKVSDLWRRAGWPTLFMWLM